MNGNAVLLNFAKEIRRATIKRVEEAQQEWMTFAPAGTCLLYTSPSPRDRQKSRMPSSA